MKKGFTLVELLVVISIIAILSVIGITIFSSAQKSARDARRRMDLEAIAKALEMYKIQNSTYILSTTFPACGGGPYEWFFSDGRWGVNGDYGGCPATVKTALSSYFSGSIPTDPFCTGSSCSNSWNDYDLYEPDSDSFILYARLETSPSNPCTYGSYNYCLKNQQ